MENIQSEIYGRSLRLSGDHEAMVLKEVAQTLNRTMQEIGKEDGPKDFESVLLRAALHLTWLDIENKKALAALHRILNEATNGEKETSDA